MHCFGERFPGPFTAHGVAKEHGENVKHLVASEASSCKADLLAAVLTKRQGWIRETLATAEVYSNPP
jgi:hypothetical protein